MSEPEAKPTSSPGETITRIEKELREIWAPGNSGETADPKTRVCTMNLLVVADSRELADKITPVVDEVTRTSLARAIIVALEPDAENSVLEGDVSAVCTKDAGQTICTERVRLTATGHVCARVASAVEALLVAEIPTALVWLGKVYADDPVFESLTKVSDRVVTDSAYTSLTSLFHLAQWAREREAKGLQQNIADLSWTRLAQWQDLVARFFDDARVASLAMNVTKFSLEQASEPRARLGAEGTLLLSWIATQLGWKASRLGGALRFRRADGEPVIVEFKTRTRPEGVAPAAIAAITVEACSASDPKMRLRGTLERDLGSGLEGQTPDADVVVFRLALGDFPVIEQRVRFGANKEAKWLERTLHRPVGDAALLESARFAEDFAEDGILCT